ncbi:hypothetical protein LBMAG42_44260 [Deltaproteobacteria bacterium]|nr:hypothetical protein LBMAG42_44260 [Deltaproteobacteria bacterium]
MLLLFAGAALARPCQLDLQVVFLNAKEAATQSAPVAVLDSWSGGLISAALGAPLESAVFELTRRKVEESLVNAQLNGLAQVRPAVESGRATGWTYWSPRTGVREPSILSSEQLVDKKMLVVHLDDPRDAAVRLGGQPPLLVDIARFFGVDVAEKVYSTIVYEKMQPPMAEAGLEALVNTGRGAKCPATS